jgi:hypothetical protein
MSAFRSPVAIALAAMVGLPFALLAGGLTLTSATDVVIIAIACMALNILVGHTGLVSFGHGAWLGLGAMRRGRRRHWLQARYWQPACFCARFHSAAAGGSPIVLRRRGVLSSFRRPRRVAGPRVYRREWFSEVTARRPVGPTGWVYCSLVARSLGGDRFPQLAGFGTVLALAKTSSARRAFVGHRRSATNRRHRAVCGLTSLPACSRSITAPRPIRCRSPFPVSSLAR